MLETQPQIIGHLKQRHMPSIRHAYMDTAEQARKEAWSYEQYLLELLRMECANRLQNRIARSLRDSKLPPSETFGNFDKKRPPSKAATHLNVLPDGCFLDRAENIPAFGNPGSGRTHLLCAVGHEPVSNGRRILFIPCSRLVQDLLIAERDLRLAKILKRLSRYDSVLIDDIGYVQHSREEMEVLFTFLEERYEKSSVMITGNLPFSKWDLIFKDPMTTAAAIDRGGITAWCLN